jgi:hypothetical protein
MKRHADASIIAPPFSELLRNCRVPPRAFPLISAVFNLEPVSALHRFKI